MSWKWPKCPRTSFHDTRRHATNTPIQLWYFWINMADDRIALEWSSATPDSMITNSSSHLYWKRIYKHCFQWTSIMPDHNINICPYTQYEVLSSCIVKKNLLFLTDGYHCRGPQWIKMQNIETQAQDIHLSIKHSGI